MREEDWKTIIVLHDCQNLTKAAHVLYVSQPTLTKQLHRIEQELGQRSPAQQQGRFLYARGRIPGAPARRSSPSCRRRKKTSVKCGMDWVELLNRTSSSFARSQLPKLLTPMPRRSQVKFKVTVMLSAKCWKPCGTRA